MDTIPGTPVGMSEHPPLFFPAPTPSDEEESGAEEAAETTGPLLPQALLSTAPEHSLPASLPPGLWLPTSPKRRARAALMEKALQVWLCRRALVQAKQEGAPIKVSMLSHKEVARKALDPNMPAKKRPIFFEKIELLRAVEPGMPVKKRVTPWIVAEPERVLPAAPGEMGIRKHNTIFSVLQKSRIHVASALSRQHLSLSSAGRPLLTSFETFLS